MSELCHRERTPVEETVIGHMVEIMKANSLESLDDTFDFVIENWYQYDATWLSVVRAMKQTGRLQ